MSSPVQPIRGKVARVLNTRQVAINKGKHDGVEVGMIFKVLSTKGTEITDPDTGEALGSVDLVKTSVKITIVQERVAVASTYRTRRVNVGGNSPMSWSSKLFEPPKWERHVETLRVDESIWEELDEVEAFVQTGDPVVQDLEVTETVEG